MPTVITCAGNGDKTVKLWDRRSGDLAMQTSYGNLPFFSVDSNAQVIVAGTSRDILFWDVRKLKNPLDVLEMSHCEDITAVDFHPMPGQ